jgi:adenosylhomocysteine nucleosidase
MAVAVIASGEPTALLLTALPVEMDAVLAHVSGDKSAQMAGPVLCEVGHFTASDGLSWRVIAAEVGPGTVDTVGAVVAVTTRFQPDVLMFVGIAGALKDDVQVGDVVAGTEVAWTERGRWSQGGYQARIRTASLSAPLSQLARKIARDGSWTRRLARPRPGAKAVVAQIASGEKVVADDEYRAWLRSAFSDALAVDTESFALARAGEVHADGQRYVVRGISDNADGSKSDHGHQNAAGAAAAFAFELLDAYSGISSYSGICGAARQ